MFRSQSPADGRRAARVIEGGSRWHAATVVVQGSARWAAGSRRGSGGTDILALAASFGLAMLLLLVIASSASAAAPRLAFGSTTASDESAVLRAYVKPEGVATTYRFDFGPTDAYGTALPPSGGSAGAGSGWVLVQVPVSGLASNTTYHYRVVATSSEGETTSADRTVVTGTGLPHGRGYEMVSPVAKHGSDVLPDSGRTRASAAGDAVQFSSLGGFGDVQGTGVATEYMSVRDGSGWSTHGITPLQDPQSLISFIAGGLEPRYVGDFSADLTTGVFVSDRYLASGSSNVADANNIFMRRDLRTPGAGSYQLLSDAFAPFLAPVNYKPWFAGASEDFTHVVFGATQNLTADAPAQPASCVVAGSACRPRVYEWVDGLGVRLAGILPADEGGAAAVRSIAGQGSFLEAYNPHTISRDGSRIFFTVGAANNAQSGDLYMREDGASTVKLNAPETGTPLSGAAKYWDASADGSKAFFTSSGQLYRYDVDAPADQHLTLLSPDNEPDDGTNIVQGVVGVSDDGEYVYFVAESQLVEGEPLRPASGESLMFLWHAGEVSYVGMMLLQDIADNVLGGTAPNLRHNRSRVTPDGKHLAFSSGSLEGLLDYDSDGCGERPCAEVYVYRAASDTAEATLACASCRPGGEKASSPASVMSRSASGGAVTTSHRSTAISSDGTRVFFTTPDPLMPEDHNGSRQDVYVYDVPNGQLHLVSTGKSHADSFFMDASADGNDVFFTTRDRLVGTDVDGNTDLYDARVGGGFAEAAPPLAQCEGDGCQGGLSDPAADVGLGGTSRFRGPSGSGQERAVFHTRRLSQRQLRRLSAGLAADVAVQVSSSGRVSVRLQGRIGKRVRSLAFASEHARTGGTVHLKVRLSQLAREYVRRHGQLRVSIVTRYGPVVEPQRTSVTLASGRARNQ